MTAAEESIWIQGLLEESRRDLVFLLNIATGSFGGPVQMPPPPKLYELMERVVEGLVQGGCMVGFGAPNLSSWRVPIELNVTKKEMPSTVIRLYEERPNDYEFLVFAIRD